MEELSASLVESQESKGETRFILRQPRSDQELSIYSSQPFSMFALDDPGVAWGVDQKRPDAVIVTQEAVVFFDLKGRIRTSGSGGLDTERGYAQLRSGIEHFAPLARMGGDRSHGDDHHDRWADGRDGLVPMPDKQHAVAALLVVFRAGSRIPATWQSVLGREILFGMLKVEQVDFNRAEVSLERVLEVAGITPGDEPVGE